MNFHCIASKTAHPQTIASLSEACGKRGVGFTLHDPKSFDYCQVGLPAAGDLLYRVIAIRTPDEPGRRIEEFLLRADIATFYRSLDIARRWQSNGTVILEKAGLPLPRTILSTTTKRSRLRQYAEFLGGFPIILKVQGGSGGVGVMKVDSFESLISVVDFCVSQGHHVSMRQYIPTKKSARLVVIGDDVVASTEYIAPDDDFRSNSRGNKKATPKLFPLVIQDLAVQAVHALGIEFGGVDILIDDKGRPYVLEVNFPCSFIHAQRATNRDVAGSMIDYLRHKSALLTPHVAWQAAVS